MGAHPGLACGLVAKHIMAAVNVAFSFVVGNGSVRSQHPFANYTERGEKS